MARPVTALSLSAPETTELASETSTLEKAPLGLRLSHDGTRVEWVALVSVPDQGERSYEVSFNLEVPANLYHAEDVWDHTQIFTRLRSPSEEGPPHLEVDDVDGLRRDALGLAHRLKMLQEDFARMVLRGPGEQPRAMPALVEADSLDARVGELTFEREEVSSPEMEVPNDESSAAEKHAWSLGLTRLTDRAAHILRLARESLPHGEALKKLSAPLQHEVALVDEFLSTRLLEYFATAERNLEKAADGTFFSQGQTAPEVVRVRKHLREELAREVEARQVRNWQNPDVESRASLSRFIGRAARLKRHFHDVLFLDVEAFFVDTRMRNWIAGLAAVLAAAFWVGFTLLPIGPTSKIKLSIGSFTLLFAVSYALKDRIKEVTRGWLLGELVRLYGQRSVTLRLPARLDPKRPVFLETRESFHAHPRVVEDELNRVLGKTQRVTSLAFRMRATVRAAPLLAKAGMHSLKHVFRYDLASICGRLDEGKKTVPVVLGDSIRLLDAPKEFWIPVELVIKTEAGEVGRLDRLLVISRNGIERIEEMP